MLGLSETHTSLTTPGREVWGTRIRFGGLIKGWDGEKPTLRFAKYGAPGIRCWEGGWRNAGPSTARLRRFGRDDTMLGWSVPIGPVKNAIAKTRRTQRAIGSGLR
jgi:hypothetical protein